MLKLLKVIKNSFNKFITVKIQRPYYRLKVRRKAKKLGIELKVQGISSVSSNTILGNNVNFNGNKIGGKGKVIIGDNFHSGPDCLMIS